MHGVALKCGYLVNKYLVHGVVLGCMHGQKLSYGSGNGVYTPSGVHLKWRWSVFPLVSDLTKSMEWHPIVYTYDIRSVVGVCTPVGVATEWFWGVHSKLECTLRQGKGWYKSMLYSSHATVWNVSLHVVVFRVALFYSGCVVEGSKVLSQMCQWRDVCEQWALWMWQRIQRSLVSEP